MTGYQKIGKYYYGFDSNGVMYRSQSVAIDGKTYRFLANGRSVLYTAKVVNVSDGKLAFRTGPSTSSKYKTMGYYQKGKVIKVVRESGDWVMASNKYWSLSKEDGKAYLKIVTTYPQ